MMKSTLLALLPFYYPLIYGATSSKDQCRSCFQLAESFEAALARESKKPRYKEFGSRLDESGRPMFPHAMSESLYYELADRVCDSNTLKTECYAVLDEHEKAIFDWFLSGRKSKPFVEAICLETLQNCTNELGAKDDRLDEDDSLDEDDDLTDESEERQQEDPLQEQDPAQPQFIKQAEEKVTATLKKAEEKVKQLMDASHIVDILKQAEGSFLAKMDALIAELRKFSEQAAALAKEKGSYIGAHVKEYSTRAARRLNLAKTPAHERYLAMAQQYWYIIAVAVTVFLALPVVALLRRRGAPAATAGRRARSAGAVNKSTPRRNH